MAKSYDVFGRCTRRELLALEASEILGCSERQFRRYRRRYEEEGLADRQALGQGVCAAGADRQAHVDADGYRMRYTGWNVKHFHEHLQRQHSFRWSYTWVKTQLHTADLVERNKRRGVHRRKRPRKPCEGMMLHQDASRFAWLENGPELDLVMTMDDATSKIYSAFLVEEEDTASTFRALLHVFTEHGLPSSLYTDRGSHYFLTPTAGEAVDNERLTQVGRALARLGIEHIPAYSPEARGRSERAFGTLQDRLPKELSLFGITGIEEVRYIREIYLPMHNDLFAVAPQVDESAFVPMRDPTTLVDILCVQQHRVVARDNTVSYEGRVLQLPSSPVRAHYVKANVRVHEYPDGTLAVFHGPCRLARYDGEGRELPDVPTTASVTPCLPPSRRGLQMPELVAQPQRRPALTASAHGAQGALQVGTKKRSSGRTKKPPRKEEIVAAAAA
jgi:hypothetical protein